METYNKLDVHVLAVNPASLESHAEFAEIYKLNFPLITDEGGKICKEYGVSISLGMPKRTVYIVGADDTIHRGWEGMPGTEELLQALK